jgi:hypothetical protein
MKHTRIEEMQQQQRPGAGRRAVVDVLVKGTAGTAGLPKSLRLRIRALRCVAASGGLRD